MYHENLDYFYSFSLEIGSARNELAEQRPEIIKISLILLILEFSYINVNSKLLRGSFAYRGEAFSMI